ncbi:ATP-grasp domain-containing protein [Solirubrobacter ginsenosidimutans]|uniref:ATP-grasp domain-containing protein n=1 Tax=Solirubrobacter ginsenosidimutans TaxID=490573 RepID=A0A9X3MTS4_9ACTN|nr:ATP-grasp domain-containing protein [Solirubrobacter ginsenosidimutans]MDA0162529.1 ATP-grasp domain-containing protein [Solirubrobacter ginsenosidimutans]
MPADPPRVLVTGVGGPSGISILRALEDAPLTLLGGDIDPYAAGLYLLDATRRSILPRGDDPRFTDDVLARCEREAIDVLVPTVDSELLPLARRRDEFAAAGVTLVLASEATLEVCLDKWALAERCHGRVRGPATVVVDAAFDPRAIPLPAIVKPRSGSGSRGIRLLEKRAELEVLERDGTLLVQEHLPGPEYSLDVLARADGHVAAVVPRERLKVDSGIAVTGRTLKDDALDAFARAVARAIELTTVANVQVKIDAAGEPALLEVNARFPGTMPLTVAAGVDMPRLAVMEALGEPIPDGPLPFAEIAMVRYFQERFFAFDDITDLQRHAAEIAS